MDYNLLKPRHRAERAHYPHHVALRVDQTLSWFYRAESCQNNPDGQFILLWVAFNTAYAQELACLNVSETATFSQFVTKICDLNQNKNLTKLVWGVYPSGMINTAFLLIVFDNRML